MNSLLTHTVAHSTRPSYRPKINHQPLKKFLSLAVSWVKVVKNGKILTFKVIGIFLIFFHWKISFQEHIIGKLPFSKYFTFKNDVQFLMTFTQLTAWLKNFLRGWLLVLGLKQGLVECATVCIKSEVMLTNEHWN